MSKHHDSVTNTKMKDGLSKVAKDLHVKITSLPKLGAIGQDGTNHINCSATGKTWMGRLLGLHCTHDWSHPYFGDFKSLMGLMYYVSSKVQDERFKRIVIVKELSGLFQRHGRHPGVKNYDAMMGFAIWIKILQNKNLLKAVIENELPYDCYYEDTKTLMPLRTRHNGAERYLQILNRVVEALKKREKPDFSDMLDSLPAGSDDCPQEAIAHAEAMERIHGFTVDVLVGWDQLVARYWNAYDAALPKPKQKPQKQKKAKPEKKTPVLEGEQPARGETSVMAPVDELGYVTAGGDQTVYRVAEAMEDGKLVFGDERFVITDDGLKELRVKPMDDGKGIKVTLAEGDPTPSETINAVAELMLPDALAHASNDRSTETPDLVKIRTYEPSAKPKADDQPAEVISLHTASLTKDEAVAPILETPEEGHEHEGGCGNCGDCQCDRD